MSLPRAPYRELRSTAWLRRRQGWLAAVLLTTRVALTVAHGSRTGMGPAPGAAGLLSTAALGGCLWWVARRQIGPWAGMLALLLYLGSPVWHTGAPMAVAPLLFVLLYTTVGVAHAVQGPRRKWWPRLLLLAALTAAAAWLSPLAAALGLALGLIGVLYLGQGRRRLLMAILAAAAVLATITILLRPTTAGSFSAPVGAAPWGFWAGDILAALSALGLWATQQRSRFFGNSAPLLAAATLLFNGHVVWALAPGLLFSAGAIADAAELSSCRVRGLVCTSALAAVLVQLAAACWGG